MPTRSSVYLSQPLFSLGAKVATPTSIRFGMMAPSSATAEPPAEPEHTFDDLVKVFDAEFLPLLKPKAALRYRVSIKTMHPWFTGTPLSQITKKRIWEFITARRQNVQTSTIRRDLACLSSMLRQAKVRDWVAINIVRDLDLKQIREAQPRIRYLSKDEEERLIAGAVPYLKPMIIFAIETGFRLSEQMTLEWTQVNFDRQEVTLIKTKTDSPRVVPLTARALEVLRKLPRHPRSPYVFCKADGSRYLNLKKGLKGAMDRAGIIDLRWHDLRRTCGCRLLQEYRADLYLVRKWLGHKSVTMTERAYAFLRVDDLHAAIARPRPNAEAPSLPESTHGDR